MELNLFGVYGNDDVGSTIYGSANFIGNPFSLTGDDFGLPNIQVEYDPDTETYYVPIETYDALAPKLENLPKVVAYIDGYFIKEYTIDGQKYYEWIKEDPEAAHNSSLLSKDAFAVKFGEDTPIEIALKNEQNNIETIRFAGGIGNIFGSTLGQHLAGGNVVGEVVLGSLFGTIGEHLFAEIAGAITGADVTAAIGEFDANLANNLKSQAIGAVSSFLAAELVDALGVEGFAGDLLLTAGGTAISTIINNVNAGAVGGQIFSGIPIEEGMPDVNADGLVDGTGSVGGAVVNAVAGFFGNQLGRAIINIDSVEGQIGASLGSSIGVYIAKAIFSANPIGIFIGAFLGTVLGGLLGNAFGGPARSGGDVDIQSEHR